jgi:hypothetical protein
VRTAVPSLVHTCGGELQVQLLQQLVCTAVPSLVRTCGGELQVQLLQQPVFSVGLDYLLARVWTI